MSEKIWLITHYWGAGAMTYYLARCPSWPEEQEAASFINNHGGPYEPEKGEWIEIEEWDGVIDNLKMDRTRHIYIKPDLLKELEHHLANDIPFDGVDVDGGIIERFTVAFTEGKWSPEMGWPRDRLVYEVDITVVNSEDGPWIEAALFLNGCDCCVIEPSFQSILGEYIFEDNGHKFTVIVEKEE